MSVTQCMVYYKLSQEVVMSLNPPIFIIDCFYIETPDAASRINLRELDNAIIRTRQLRLITVSVSPLFCALYAAAGNRLRY